VGDTPEKRNALSQVVRHPRLQSGARHCPGLRLRRPGQATMAARSAVPPKAAYTGSP
jgi:hypothetical protein